MYFNILTWDIEYHKLSLREYKSPYATWRDHIGSHSQVQLAIL